MLVWRSPGLPADDPLASHRLHAVCGAEFQALATPGLLDWGVASCTVRCRGGGRRSRYAGYGVGGWRSASGLRRYLRHFRPGMRRSLRANRMSTGYSELPRFQQGSLAERGQLQTLFLVKWWPGIVD